MRLALTYVVVGAILCAPLAGADRKSWNKVRYVGGTVAIKTSPYDWNTTIAVTVNPDTIVVGIAPAKIFSAQQTVRIKPSQIDALLFGSGSWRRVAELAGAQMPAKTPGLFGLLEHRPFFAILYETDDGKKAGMLLESYFGSEIQDVLKALSGKEIEFLRQ